MKTKTTRHLKKLQLISFLIGLTMVISNCSKKPDTVLTENTALTDNAKLGMLVNPESIQKTFDPYGPLPETKHIKLSSGKTLYYTDTKDGDKVILSFPGSSGDALGFSLYEHLRTFRKQLSLRIISVERNGLGSTPYDSTWTPEEYARNCVELLDKLGISEVRLFSQSAGGLYLPHVANLLGNRVTSIHLASSIPYTHPEDYNNTPFCSMSTEDQLNIYSFFLDPNINFLILFQPRDLAVLNNIPRAAEVFNYLTHNSLRSKNLMWLIDDNNLACRGLFVANNVNAPVYIYHGTNDYLVPPSLYIDAWKKVFRNIRKIRMYQNEEHLAFFRNFEQVLLDMAGLDDKTILNTNGHNLIVSENAVNSLLKNGAVRGIVAWANLDKRE